MKKIYIIMILVITNLITISSLIKMSSRASYHMKETEEVERLLEGILDRVEGDRPDYFWDVLMESQEYMEYEELKY